MPNGIAKLRGVGRRNTCKMCSGNLRRWNRTPRGLGKQPSVRRPRTYAIAFQPLAALLLVEQRAEVVDGLRDDVEEQPILWLLEDIPPIEAIGPELRVLVREAHAPNSDTP